MNVINMGYVLVRAVERFSLEDAAVVEVAALVDVTVARGMTGNEFLKGRHILEFRDRLGQQGRAGRLVGTENPARTPTF
jgi:hypothetical protein